MRGAALFGYANGGVRPRLARSPHRGLCIGTPATRAEIIGGLKVRCFLATPRKRRHSRLILISVGVKLAEFMSSSERQTLLETMKAWPERALHDL